MEIEKLKTATREMTGKGAARRLRREGMIPGVIYGFEVEPMLIKVNSNELRKILNEVEAKNPFFNIVGEDDQLKNVEGSLVILKELQIHPITYEFLHLDLHKIDTTKELAVEVPIHYIGKADIVKKGGLLQEIRRTLEISAIPTKIPDYLEIDVTDLEIGDSVHLKDIALPEGSSVDTNINYTVSTVIAPKVYEEEVEEEIDELLEGEEVEEGEESEEGMDEDKQEDKE